MADDLNRSALLTIDLDVESVNQGAAEAKQKVADLTAQMKQLKAAGKENTAEYVALQGQMRSYQQQVTQAVNVNKQLTLAQNTATGSIDEMRAQLSLVTRQYNSLSAEQRGNTEVGGRLLSQQKALSDSLKELESAGGNNSRTVGQYREEIEKALGSLNPFQSQLQGITQAFDSLKVMTAAQAAAQAEATIATEVAAAAEAQLATATAALTAAQSAEAAAQAQITALTQGGAVTMAELTAVQQRLAVVTTELTAAQLAQSAAATGSAAANQAAAAASETAAGGFKLFDNILKASIIGAIAAVILLLINYLRSFDPIVDKVEQAFAGLNAALDFVISSIKNVFAGFTSFGDLLKGFGNFLANPVKAMKEFGGAMVQAAKDAATLKAAQQDLEDTLRINEVKTAETQQRVAELILKARNRSLDNTQRKKLLDEAAVLDKEDFDRRTAQANEELRIATEALRIKGRLSEQELANVKKGGLAVILELQGQLSLKGKITDDEVDMYKKAQLNIIAAKDESTKRQEKIQNKIDADAEKAEAAAEKAREKAEAAAEKSAAKAEERRKKQQKADEELALSLERTRALSQTGRDAELIAIEVDFQKKIDAAKGYSKLIQQLATERDAVLAKKREAFAIQDTKDDNALQQTLYANKVKALQQDLKALTDYNTEFTTLTEQQQAKAIDLVRQENEVKKQANAEAHAFQLSQQDLTELQKAQIDEAYKQQEIDRQVAFNEQRDALETELNQKRFDRMQQEVAATEAIEKQKSDIRNNGLNLIQQVFGKQSALGKAAFLIQKALAINEIIIQTQKQVAAIQLAAAYQTASAALTVPFPLSIAAIAGIQAAAAVKTAIAIVGGIISGAAIVATAVQGFATGGVYESDGAGGVLPGYSKYDNINAKLRSGEGIVVSEAMRNPQARAAVSQINVAYGGKPFSRTNTTGAYADGGVFSSAATAVNAGQQEIQNVIQQTAQAVAAAMPQQILVVEEVQAALQDKAYIAEKSTI